jgi:hypothetical protein
MSKRCYHRWSRNGICTNPGCSASKPPEQPLKSHEQMNYLLTRDRQGKLHSEKENKDG